MINYGIVLIALILIIVAYHVGKDSAEQDWAESLSKGKADKYLCYMRSAFKEMEHLKSIIVGYQKRMREDDDAPV